MTVREAVEKAASGAIRQNYTKKLDSVLYPAAFADDNSWHHVKDALDLHDKYVREYIIAALELLLQQD